MGQVLVYPGEDGFRVAECPNLSGCITQGETREEAIDGYVLALQEDGLPVPEDKLDALPMAL